MTWDSSLTFLETQNIKFHVLVSMTFSLEMVCATFESKENLYQNLFSETRGLWQYLFPIHWLLSFDNSVFWNRPSPKLQLTVTIISSRAWFPNHYLNDLLCEKILNFPRSNKRAEDSTSACIFQCPLVTLTFFGRYSKLSKPFLLGQLSHCLTQGRGPSVNVWSEHT